MLEGSVHRSDARFHVEARAAAVDAREGPLQRSVVLSSVGVRVKGRLPPVSGSTIHAESVEARNLSNGIVDERVEAYRVRTAVRESQKGIAGRPGNS